MEPHYVELQGSLLSVEVSLAWIDPADQKLPGDNQGHIDLSIFCLLLYTSFKILLQKSLITV